MQKLFFIRVCVCVCCGVCVCGGGLSHNRTSVCFFRGGGGVGGSFLCILRVFLRSRYKVGTFLEVA